MKRIIIPLLILVLCVTLTPGATLAQSEGQTHVVQPGENLFRIALKYHVSVQAIATINGITNPTIVYVGQRLVIPASSAASPILPTSTLTGTPTPELTTPTPQPTASVSETNTVSATIPITIFIPMTVTTAATATPTPRPTTHVVAAGENLYRIALRYGLTTAQLAAANGISNFNSVYVGQVLRIPGAGESLAVTPLPNAVYLPGTANPAASSKKILVSISQQHLWAYNGNQVVYSFVASTGLATSPTKPGIFRVLDKIPNAYASQWNLQMPYWMGIYYVGTVENGIHALPILASGQRLWAGLLGRPASFGCVILDTWASKQLYDWAEVGTPVIIQP